MLERCEVVFKFLHRDFGIDLGGGDVRMTENTADAFDGYPLVECQNGKAMSGAMHGDMLTETTFIHNTKNTFGHRAVFHRGKDCLSLLMVSPDDFQWNVEQLHLEGYLGLMPLGNDPGATIDGDNI